MPEVYQSSNAAKNIADVISAMTDAQKSQLELKKAVMMKQIGDKMDLAQNKAKLQQGVESNINQKQANVNWLEQLSGQGEQTNAAGVATNAMPTVQGAPALPGQPQANPMAQQPMPTPSTTLTAPTQPNAGAGGQPIVPPGRTQAPMTPVLNSPTAPNAGINSQPIMPPSVQYQNLGYKPVSPQQLLQARQQAKQPINMADISYAQAHKKLMNGTATDGEINNVIHPMNNRDENGGSTSINQTVPSTNLEVQPTPQMSKIQAGLRSMEKMQGLPSGTLWMNPSTGDAEISPVAKAKLDAQGRWDVQAPDRYGAKAEQDLMHIFSMRSGALGVQDAKINQAMHVKQLFDQAYDPKTGVYNLKGPQFAEATQALAVLVSNSNQTSEAQRQEIKQRTLTGDFNGALTYAFGIPKNATSQQIAEMYVKAVDRQGVTAQYEKEKDISDIKKLDSFRQLAKVDPERAQNLYDAHFGVDYRSYINKPWEERVKEVTGKSPDESSGGGNTPPQYDPQTQKLQQNSKTGEYRVVPL